jgi:hypothetical protein
MNRRVAIACTVAILLVSAVGCGSNPAASGLGSSMEEAMVHGTVRVNGKPVNNGMVRFRTAPGNQPNPETRTGDIRPNGSYSVKAVIGENYVEVTCKELNTKQNRKSVENKQLIMVKSGDNAVDIEIPPKK